MSPTAQVRHSSENFPGESRWRFTPLTRAMVIAAIVLSILPFINALFQLVNVWNLEPEYSHGMLIPPIAAFLVWQQRDWLSQQSFQGSWSGLVLVAFGLFAWLVGELSTVTAIVQYAFLLVVYGIALSLTGWKVFRRLWMPLLILVFMIPLPAFFSNSLSLQLQLISSQIGVWVIRLFGISVYLEGNVIDLGAFQLQVAEACNGLRYLFPLMTLAFILSYFFKAPIWKRVLLFAASIPIAILMNSFRIGVIGVTVEYWGVKMAEGVLHDFEGWVVFMLSTMVLIGVATVITRIGKRSASLRESLNFDLGPKKSPGATQPPAVARPVPRSFIVAAALAATASLYAFTMPPRAIESAPDRASLLEFPTRIGDWQGRRQPMERVYLDALQLDDYISKSLRRVLRVTAQGSLGALPALVHAGWRVDHQQSRADAVAGRQYDGDGEPRRDRARSAEADRLLLVPAARS
jgi:exosortase D (VPLPA-CTERM-specific)